MRSNAAIARNHPGLENRRPRFRARAGRAGPRREYHLRVPFGFLASRAEERSEQPAPAPGLGFPHVRPRPLPPGRPRWFTDAPRRADAPQREGWPPIRAGRHTLIAAPTGSGKTLAAFLSAIDALLRAGRRRSPTRRTSSTSRRCAPSRTTSRRTSRAPLAEIRALDPALAGGARARAHGRHARRRADRDDQAAAAHPRHDAGVALHPARPATAAAAMLATVATVIVDEIHALARDKRGSHLALSLERLEALAGAARPAHRPLRDAEAARRGRPLPRRAPGRACALVDAGTFRDARPRRSRSRPRRSRRSARTSSGRRSTRAWRSSCASTGRRSSS